jgi:arylsulfatase A-like enzyme
MIRLRQPGLLVLFIVWISLYVIPLLVVNEYCDVDTGLCPLRYYYAETKFVLLSLVATFLLETALLLALLTFVARSKVMVLFTWISLTFYFSALALSTHQFRTQGKFLTLEQVPLISFLLDPVFLRFNVTAKDELMFIQSAIIGTIVSTLWILAGVRIIKFNNSRRYRPILLVGGICSVFSLYPPAPYLLDQRSLSFARMLASNTISPQLSIGWNRFFFGSAEPTFTEEIALLAPIELDRTKGTSHATGSEPNILIFVIEALRSDIVSSRNQDKSDVMPFTWDLMSKSIAFENAYSTAPETEGSVFSIITGLHPLRGEARHYGGAHSFPMVRIYDLLSQGGYRTGYFSWEWASMRWYSKSDYLDAYEDPYLLNPKFVQNSLPPALAEINDADTYLVPNGDRYLVKRLKEWISNTNDERPFFGISYLYSSHFFHQWPNEMPPAFSPHILDLEHSFLRYPEEVTPIVRNRYYNSLRFIDGLIADIYDHLKRNNLVENTTIIITGDHGELFHEHGQVTHSGPLYESVIRVPLIFKNLPKDLCAFDTVSPISLLDLAPSILTLAKLPPHPNFQGQSLIDPCQGPKRDSLPVFSSVQLNTHEDSVIKWPWKFVRNYTFGTNRLYNLETDPDENINLEDSNSDRSLALKKLLISFRNRQLTYYNDRELSQKFYPPKIAVNYQKVEPRRESVSPLRLP